MVLLHLAGVRLNAKESEIGAPRDFYGGFSLLSQAWQMNASCRACWLLGACKLPHGDHHSGAVVGPISRRDLGVRGEAGARSARRSGLLGRRVEQCWRRWGRRQGDGGDIIAGRRHCCNSDIHCQQLALDNCMDGQTPA